jgi:hypothetical protein
MTAAAGLEIVSAGHAAVGPASGGSTGLGQGQGLFTNPGGISGSTTSDTTSTGSGATSFRAGWQNLLATLGGETSTSAGKDSLAQNLSSQTVATTAQAAGSATSGKATAAWLQQTGANNSSLLMAVAGNAATTASPTTSRASVAAPSAKESKDSKKDAASTTATGADTTGTAQTPVITVETGNAQGSALQPVPQPSQETAHTQSSDSGSSQDVLGGTGSSRSAFANLQDSDQPASSAKSDATAASNASQSSLTADSQEAGLATASQLADPAQTTSAFAANGRALRDQQAQASIQSGTAQTSLQTTAGSSSQASDSSSAAAKGALTGSSLSNSNEKAQTNLQTAQQIPASTARTGLKNDVSAATLSEGDSAKSTGSSAPTASSFSLSSQGSASGLNQRLEQSADQPGSATTASGTGKIAGSSSETTNSATSSDLALQADVAATQSNSNSNSNSTNVGSAASRNDRGTKQTTGKSVSGTSGAPASSDAAALVHAQAQPGTAAASSTILGANLAATAGTNGIVKPDGTGNSAAGDGTSTTTKTFAALDAGTGTAAWVSTGARQVEAGYKDPELGWVSVQATSSGGGVHATLVPGSTNAAEALSGHLAGLNTYLAESRSQVDSVTVAALDARSTGLGADHGTSRQGQGQGTGQGAGQEIAQNLGAGTGQGSGQGTPNQQSFAPQSVANPFTSSNSSQVDGSVAGVGSTAANTDAADANGAHISVMA